MYKKIFSGLMSAVLIVGLILPQLSGFAEEESTLKTAPIINVDVLNGRSSFKDGIVSANHRFSSNGFGMFDAESGEVYEDFVNKTAEVNYGLIRYPAGTIGNLFKWKDSIGAPENRKNVVLGNRQRQSEVPLYGLDEHMKYVEQIGASAIYMVAEASETPQDAADLVEYLNAPNDGSNPGGGIDWAAVRAANGHPEPYGVKYFEIGNEMSSGDQRYWLDYPSLTGKTAFQEKYTLGDRVQVTNEPARKYGTWIDNEALGEKSEEFYSQYYPVEKGSQTIYVNGVKWSEVSSFEGQAPDAMVYVFDAETGKITFGDGVNGAVPTRGSRIRMDYIHVHAGFEAYYDAMKAIDPDIVILSCIEKIYEYIGDKQKCDGIVKHNYPVLANASNERELHDAYMTTAESLINSFVSDDAAVKQAAGRNDVILATTEYGVIPISRIWTEEGNDLDRDEARVLSRGLHFATVLIAAAQTEKEILIHQGFTAYSFGGGQGLGSAGSVYNALYAQDPENSSFTIESSMALAYKMFGNGHGETVLNSFVQNNPAVDAVKQSDYDALRVLASKDSDGTVYLFVVNRDPERDIPSVINLSGFTASGNAEIMTLNAENYYSCNTPEHPNDVFIAEMSKPVSGSEICHTFPAHSIVVLKLSGEESTAKWQNNFEIQDFESAFGLPVGFKNIAQTTEVVSDSGNKVLKLTRNANGKASVKASLSGKDVTDSMTKYSSGIKISFKIKAEKTDSRMNISVRAGNSTVMNLAYDSGMLMCNGTRRQYITAGEWHEIEFVLDYKAKQYMMYADGEYVHSLRSFNNASSGGVDAVLFDVENKNASFYIDDFLVQTLAEGSGRVVGGADVIATTERGIAPTLPDTVRLISDRGDMAEADVAWEEMKAVDYGTPGMFAVSGNANGATVSALVTVNEREMKPSSVTVKQLPNKLSYKKTDSLDTTGMIIEIVYPDGVTAVTESGADFSYSFEKSGKVTVSVNGVEAFFEVEVEGFDAVLTAVISGCILVVLGAAAAVFTAIKRKKNNVA